MNSTQVTDFLRCTVPTLTLAEVNKLVEPSEDALSYVHHWLERSKSWSRTEA